MGVFPSRVSTLNVTAYFLTLHVEVREIRERRISTPLIRHYYFLSLLSFNLSCIWTPVILTLDSNRLLTIMRILFISHIPSSSITIPQCSHLSSLLRPYPLHRLLLSPLHLLLSETRCPQSGRLVLHWCHITLIHHLSLNRYPIRS